MNFVLKTNNFSTRRTNPENVHCRDGGSRGETAISNNHNGQLWLLLFNVADILSCPNIQ